MQQFTRKLDTDTKAAGTKAGENLGDGITRGADGRLRNARGHFVAIGKEFGAGMGDGLREEFPRGLASVGDRIKSWGRGVVGEGRTIGRGLGGQLGDGVKSGVSTMGRGLATGGRLLTGFAAGGVAALGLVTGAAAVMGGSVASANEQATISFTTMLRKAGDTEREARARAKGFIGDLQKLAATTPFEFADLQAYSSKLVSAGVAVRDIIPMMRNLGDVTSGVGTGAEGINRATVALQQMIAAGRIQAEDLNQLRDAGIPVYDLLAGATGKSKKEIAELAQTGKLGKKELDQLLDTLASDTPKGLEKFSGLMGEQSTSLKGMWSNLTDTVSQGLGRVGEKAMPQLKAGLKGLSGVLSTTFDYLDDHGDDLERIFRAGGRAVKSFGGIVRPVLKAFTGGLTDGEDTLTSLADWMDTHQGDIVGFFVGAGKAAIGLGRAVAMGASAGLRAYAGLQQAVQAVLDVILRGMKSVSDASAAMWDALGMSDRADTVRAGSAQLQELIDRNRNNNGGDAAKAMAESIDSKLLPSLSRAEDALDSYGRNARGAASRSDQWNTALQRVSESVKDNGRSLSSHTKAGKANRQTIKDAMDALNDDAQAAGVAARKKGTLKDAEKAAAKVMREGTRDIKDQTKKAGLNEDAVDGMITKMKKTPKEIKTAINFSTNANKVLAKLIIKGSDVGIAAAKDVFKTAAGGITGRFMGQLPGRTPLSRGDDRMLPLVGGGLQHLRGGEGVQVTEAMDAYEKRRLDTMNRAVLAGATPARVRETLGEPVVGHTARGGTVGRSAVPAAVLDIGPAATEFAVREAKKTAAAYAKQTTRLLQSAMDAVRSAASAGVIDVSNPTGRTKWRGGTFTNLFAANLRRAEKIAGRAIPVIQGGFRPSTSYSGTSHRGDAIDTNVNYKSLRAMRSVGIATGDRTGLGNWQPHMHAVPTKGAGYGAGSAPWQAQDYARRGGASQSPRSPWGLAYGGIVGQSSPAMADLAAALRTGRGYASGTTGAAAGFHWTGEKDAELVVNPQLRRYDGGEKVLKLGKGKASGGDRGPLIGAVHFEGRSGVLSELNDLHFGVRTLQVGRKGSGA